MGNGKRNYLGILEAFSVGNMSGLWGEGEVEGSGGSGESGGRGEVGERGEDGVRGRELRRDMWARRAAVRMSM